MRPTAAKDRTLQDRPGPIKEPAADAFGGWFSRARSVRSSSQEDPQPIPEGRSLLLAD